MFLAVAMEITSVEIWVTRSERGRRQGGGRRAEEEMWWAYGTGGVEGNVSGHQRHDSGSQR